MATFGSLNTPYVILTGVVIVGIVFIFTILQPMVTSISQIRSETASQAALVQERRAFLRTTDRKIADLQLQDEHEQRLATMLPAAERLEDALRIVHQGEQATGLVLENIVNNSRSLQTQVNAKRARGETVTIPAKIIPLSFSIDYRGTYQQWRAFLTELERSPRLMDITSVTVKGSDQQTNQVSGQIAVMFYMQEVELITEL
jgi:Tfp pilus assembly protein PilO